MDIVITIYIGRRVWTAVGISSRQRRFHYRVRLRDAYPGEFRVHKAQPSEGNRGVTAEEAEVGGECRRGGKKKEERAKERAMMTRAVKKK